MGILGKIRRRLPIVGSGGNVKASGPAPSRPAPPPYVDPEPEPQSPRGDQDVATFLKDLVTSNLVVLFMKGSPANPMAPRTTRSQLTPPDPKPPHRTPNPSYLDA